jgi:transcription initiation factor TFIIH subunit 4
MVVAFQILYFVIGSRDSERYVSGPVIQLLRSIGVAPEDRSETSAAAFQFLFQALGSQLWRLLMSYTALASINRNEFLRFLFRLSFMNVGVAYAIPASAQLMIQQLSEFGLVYIDPRAPSYFIPTPFIAHLSTSAASTSSGSAAGTLALTSISDLLRSGYIIVETTFVVYAYTSSPLHVALLRTFTTIHRELPNLVIGKITKESVRQAITRGISKNEVFTVCSRFAHPNCALLV